jgi:hypothetical protein
LKQRTLRIFAFIVIGYALLVAPGFIWPAWFDSPAGLLVLIPGMSIYLFHHLGIPGLLQHKGLCGWGMCAPTAFGWVFLVAVWLALALLVAWGISAAMSSIAARRANK